MNSDLSRIVALIDADLAQHYAPLTQDQIAALDNPGRVSEALAMLDDLEARCAISSHSRGEAAAYVVGNPIESLTLFGSRFESCSTGGNCLALICKDADGSHVLITAYDDAELPTARNWSIGIYDADVQQLAYMTHDGDSEGLDDLREPADPNDCAECARSHGPHYSGPCDHGDAPTDARADRLAAQRVALAALVARSKLTRDEAIEQRDALADALRLTLAALLKAEAAKPADKAAALRAVDAARAALAGVSK